MLNEQKTCWDGFNLARKGEKVARDSHTGMYTGMYTGMKIWYLDIPERPNKIFIRSLHLDCEKDMLTSLCRLLKDKRCPRVS